jgi:hypothetical protein
MMDLAYYRAELVAIRSRLPSAALSEEARSAGESPRGTGRVVQTGIKIIKIIYNNPGKQSEDQYGGDPSEDVGPPFPPVVDQQPIHVSPHCRVRVVRRAAI